MYETNIPRPLTGRRAEIQEQLNRQIPRLLIGNAGNRVLRMMFNAVPYVCFPKGEHFNTKTRETEFHDGTLAVEDDIRRNPILIRRAMVEIKRGKKPANYVVPRNQLVSKASEIVHSLLRKHEKEGLYLIDPSDKQETERRRAQAAIAARRFEIEKATNLVAGYHRRANKFQADPANAGMRLPMTASEVSAMDFLQEVEDAENDESGRLKCRMPEGKCGYWTYEPMKLEAHIERQHKELFAAEEAERKKKAKKADKGKVADEGADAPEEK